MDLSIGRTPWLQTFSNAPTYESLHEDLVCDVLIIGGGTGGALCAWRLVNAGLDVVLVDTRRIGLGSSHANTGLFQVANDMSLHEMIKEHGEEEAVQFYRLCQKAVGELEQIAEGVSIPIEFARRPSLYYASTEEDVAKISREYQSLREHGFPVLYLTEDDIAARFPFRKAAALWTEGDSEANPYRMVHALVSDSVQKGLRVYEHTEVIKIDDEGSTPVFYTTQGHKIKADKGIFATGYADSTARPPSDAQIGSSFAIATEPIKDLSFWTDRALIWETARPYLYMRTTLDNRVIVGGLDENIADGPRRDEQLVDKTDELLERFISLFPMASAIRIAYRWAGTFGTSKDGMPFFGRHPKYKNSYSALGYGGNGTVYYVIGAKLLTDAILSGEDDEMTMLSPNRNHWIRSTFSALERTWRIKR